MTSVHNQIEQKSYTVEPLPTDWISPNYGQYAMACAIISLSTVY